MGCPDGCSGSRRSASVSAEQPKTVEYSVTSPDGTVRTAPTLPEAKAISGVGDKITVYRVPV